MSPGNAPQIIHASTVSVAGRALVILGPPGSGKSGLALQMMALGAGLIADDRTQLILREGQVIAAAPPTIAGLIEARGVGVLAAPQAPPAPVILAVDMGEVEAQRLPPIRHIDLLGQPIRLLHKTETAYFPSALLLYLQGGASE